MEIIIPVVIWLGWSAICWLIGYIVGWNKAHKYWERVDSAEDHDGHEQ